MTDATDNGARRTAGALPLVVTCALVLLLGGAVGLSWFPKGARPVSGEAVGYRRTDSDGAGKPLLLVKLDSGRQVRVQISDALPVRYGERVTLTEVETYLFGFRRYQFVRYDPRAEQNPPLDAQKDVR